MEAYVRDAYFAVVKADGSDPHWEADSESTVRTHVNLGRCVWIHSAVARTVFPGVLRFGSATI